MGLAWPMGLESMRDAPLGEGQNDTDRPRALFSRFAEDGEGVVANEPARNEGVVAAEEAEAAVGISDVRRASAPECCAHRPRGGRPSRPQPGTTHAVSDSASLRGASVGGGVEDAWRYMLTVLYVHRMASFLGSPAGRDGAADIHLDRPSSGSGWRGSFGSE